jgi:hypothetical protein
MEKLNVILNNQNQFSSVYRILCGNWEITFENGLPRIRAIDGTIYAEPVCSNVIRIGVKEIELNFIGVSFSTREKIENE